MSIMFSQGSKVAKKPDDIKVYKSGYQLQVLKADQLLSLNRHQALIQLVQQICGLPAEYTEQLYNKTIDNFAEFVQVLPHQSNGALSSLLNLGLARGAIALQKFMSQDRNADPLLNYAVYTAALLMDVSKVLINQRVMIVDEEGHIMDEWRPFEATLPETSAQFYKIYPTNLSYQSVQDAITPLLARQLMPKQGFLWIASDPQVFADWLAALTGDTTRGGRLTSFMSLIKPGELDGILESLLQIPVEMIESVANPQGEDFYKWLKNNLDSGEIKVNTADAAVHVVNEGVFIEKRLFKQFCDICNVPVHAHLIFAQFGNLMGILRKDSSSFMSDKYISKYAGDAPGGVFAGAMTGTQRSLREGMVVKDARMIFVNAKIPSVTQMMKTAQASGDLQNLPAILQQINLNLKNR